MVFYSKSLSQQLQIQKVKLKVHSNLSSQIQRKRKRFQTMHTKVESSLPSLDQWLRNKISMNQIEEIYRKLNSLFSASNKQKINVCSLMALRVLAIFRNELPAT